MTADHDVGVVDAPERWFRVAPEDIAALAAELGRAAGLSNPFDAYTLQIAAERVAFVYRTTQWISAQGYLGGDTLDQLAKSLPTVVDLLTDEINRTRLLPPLVEAGFGDIRPTLEAYETMLALLAAICTVAPQEHQGRSRGRPVTHPGLDEAFRTALCQFRRIFDTEDIRGRSGWTQEEKKPLRPTHLSAIFIYGVMKLAAPDHPNLAETLRWLMDKEVATLSGPRPGRPDR